MSRVASVQPYVFESRYRFVYDRQHPLASKGGFVGEHRMVLYALLGPGSCPCHWCGQPATTRDHLVPLSAGGAHEPGNIVPACQPCNSGRR